MKVELYKRARLNRDIPEEGLKAGDVVVPLDILESKTHETGCTIEVFNVEGQTVLVTAIALSALEPIAANDIPQVRHSELCMRHAG